MKIAVATKEYAAVSGHAGQTSQWLVYDLAGHRLDAPPPTPTREELEKEQLLHHFQDDGPHPLDGVDIIVAGSAGDGFIRHMKKRGADVLLTGEQDPPTAVACILNGDALADTRFDITTTLCKLRDFFSRH